jgi:hypothetical protein
MYKEYASLLPSFLFPGVSHDYVLELFGEFFLHFALDKGYGDIFTSMSRNFKDFVDNVDYLHW